MAKISPEQKRKIATNYTKYLLNCDKIKKHPVIKLSTIQRVAQPFCKTTLLNDKVLTLALKGTTKKILLTRLPEEKGVISYFKITLCFVSEIDLLISARNTLELITKINHKYELLKPSFSC